MANDPFSFNISLGTGNNDQVNATRYIAPPFRARLISEDEAMVVLGRAGELHRAASTDVRLLGLCDRFRTLADHAAHAMRELRLQPGQQPAVRDALKRLADHQLLRTEAQLRDDLIGSGARRGTQRTIPTLFVRTCARPETLERLLASIAGLGDEPGIERCVVLDDDAGETQTRTRALVERFRADFPVALYYISREARRELIAGIAGRAGVDADRLVWFIEGEPQDPEPGYGAGVNLALLLGAGDLMAMIDDDATLSSYRLPDCRNDIEFTPVPGARVVFPDPDRNPVEQFESGPDNPLTAHGQWLGTSTSAIAASSDSDTGRLFAAIDPQMVYDLTGSGRVRITSNGTLGDPGTSGIQWLYAETAEHLRALCDDEARYRKLIERRQIARGPEAVQATTAISLMTTTLTGIDNRDLLLPTQPRGGNEDLLLGSLTSYLYPGTLHATLPHMLYHMRPEPRRWSSEDLDRARNPNRGNLLAEHMERLAESTPATDPESRIAVLEGWLRNLASMQPDELTGMVHQALLGARGDTIEHLQAVRRELDPPAWMAADFDRLLRAHAGLEDRDRERLTAITRTLPDFARRYADGIGDWRKAWAHCRKAGVDALLELVPEGVRQ